MWKAWMPERALQRFDKMQQQGLEPNVITYIAVSSACGKCRMPERALQLFDKMQQQGLEPNRITYIAVSSACGKCRMPKRALRLFDETQQQGLEPGAVTSGPHTHVFFFTLPTPHASKKQHPVRPKSTYVR